MISSSITRRVLHFHSPYEVYLDQLALQDFLNPSCFQVPIGVIFYTLNNIMYTLHNIMHTLYNIMYTLYNIMHTLYNIMYSLYNIIYTLYTIMHTLYKIMYTLYKIMYTLYNIMHTLYNIMHTLYYLMYIQKHNIQLKGRSKFCQEIFHQSPSQVTFYCFAERFWNFFLLPHERTIKDSLNQAIA